MGMARQRRSLALVVKEDSGKQMHPIEKDDSGEEEGTCSWLQLQSADTSSLSQYINIYKSQCSKEIAGVIEASLGPFHYRFSLNSCVIVIVQFLTSLNLLGREQDDMAFSI
mmetsp:Transcript_25486/g.56659  ORF Transcript_25486/g.56659 Transcript_25486/m.56659 type:complete len:111 (+) Transcript_25486:695-1027(+)